MKDYLTYEVGDDYTLYGAGPDGMSSVLFTVEFVNETVAIAHCQSRSAAYSDGMNIDPNIFRQMSHDEVRTYMGDAFSCLTEFDVFLDLNFDHSNYHEAPIFDDDGNELTYRILNEGVDFRAKCGEQCLNNVCLVKVFGNPRSGEVVPLTKEELIEHDLYPKGNYFWLIQSLTKRYSVNEWVCLSKENMQCDYGWQYIFEGEIVYSHNNWAVLKCTKDFITINGEHPYKLISYEDLSRMPGFTAHFEIYEGDQYVLIEQQTGETYESFMPLVATMPDGEKVHFRIIGYKYQESSIIGRYVSLDQTYYFNFDSQNSWEKRHLEKETKEIHLENSFSKIKEKYSSILARDAYVPACDEDLYYFPLEDGEKIQIVHS